LAVFVNVSFVLNKKLFNKYGKVVMGCALSTTPLCIIEVNVKQIMFFIFLLFNNSLFFSQVDEHYKIEWKLDQDETVIYKTKMQRVDSLEHQSFKFNFDKIIEEMPDSLKNQTGEQDSTLSKMNDFFESLNSIGDNYNFYSVLSKNADESFDVKMIMKKAVEGKNNQTDSLLQMFTQLNHGVVLRGKLNRDGSIQSFYLQQNQKNMLSMYFELPTEPVKIGDSWSLEINLSQFDQNFICHKSERRNKIELIDVKEIDGEEIAYIKYDIFEMVEGYFNNPFSKSHIPTFMQMSFSGISQFSITNGRWKIFNCMSATKSSGFTSANVVESNIMIPVENITLDELLSN
jgi:hypothetical protein